MELKVIAHARNGHTDKFGIPRQSREESPIVTRIVFEPEFCIPESIRALEGFSHLWLIWGFSEVDSWSPTVRPPRLGGNTRVGVFATRSPFRPNPIGLSSVKLLSIQQSAGSHQIELLVSGADVLDGTPIYDIKPYLSFSDSHPDAKNGFAEDYKDTVKQVDWSVISRYCTDIGPILDRQWTDDVSYILAQDPRPGYQHDPDREYKIDYAGFTITFSANEQTVFVKKIEKTGK